MVARDLACEAGAGEQHGALLLLAAEGGAEEAGGGGGLRDDFSPAVDLGELAQDEEGAGVGAYDDDVL